MKLKPKYYKVAIILALEACCFAIPFVFLSNLTISLDAGKAWAPFIFLSLLLLYVIMRLGYMILFEFYEVEFTRSSITLKNIITQKQIVIESYIAGFKINPITVNFHWLMMMAM